MSQNVYVAASAGDAGGAIGAAYALFYEHYPRDVEKAQIEHAYLGPSYRNNGITELIQSHQGELSAEKFKIVKTSSFEELTKRTAGLIAEGKVIGCFQGRMKWGPRTLETDRFWVTQEEAT